MLGLERDRIVCFHGIEVVLGVGMPGGDGSATVARGTGEVGQRIVDTEGAVEVDVLDRALRRRRVDREFHQDVFVVVQELGAGLRPDRVVDDPFLEPPPRGTVGIL